MAITSVSPAHETGPPMEIRRSTDADRAAILALGRRSLGWLGDRNDERFFEWKHFENPFGPSPMWVAEIDGRVAGFRTFLRWNLVGPSGARYHAVRAVDTATDPEFQGRGIFTALTLAALDELDTEGVDFVFNTPNDQSRPGYLKMGWHVVGRLPVAVRPTHARALRTIARARVPATRGAVAVNVGTPAAAAFADTAALEELLDSAEDPGGFTTERIPEYLAWRYGLDSLHYRVVTSPEGLRGGFAVFHLRRRGPALEAVVGDVLTPVGRRDEGRALVTRIARDAGADYLIRSDRRLAAGDGFVRVPGAGPVLTVRQVRTPPPARLAAWRLGMGDIELF
jgi:GNAT superfamily N-acetyltransferase